MTLLSVNVNKIATLRNARGGSIPDVVQCSKDILEYGAHGITVHPRPDGRHIKKQDVIDLKKLLKNYPDKEFNIEGYPSEEFLDFVFSVSPDQCTLVPDPPHVLTSNAGWKIFENQAFLKKVISVLKDKGIRVSLFVDPLQWADKEKKSLFEVSPDRIELYTEAYAKSFGSPQGGEILNAYVFVAQEARKGGLEVNAGHDLNLTNIFAFKQAVNPVEVSIGHALIAESLYWGFKEVIFRYREALK